MARKSKRLAVQEEKPLENKNIYNVAVYLRLSVEEKRDKDDSESLENQRDIILDYLQDKTDMKLFSVYCDNGETGTNFEREAFQRMMYDVYNGKVNCIIVKDLSRFGREYIEAGDYLDRIFPLLVIRFIAINDNVDNHVSPFDISVPIKNIINTLYARDISKKVSAALRIKQANGEFIGTYAAYGYLKDPDDKHKIIVDEKTAPIVRQIFEWKAEGMGYASISRKLFDMKIMPPGRYRYDEGIVKDKRYANCEFWNAVTLKNMLTNQVYIGNLTQGRRKSNLYDGVPEKKVEKEKWVVIEGTHEPIVEKELFDKVQRLLDEAHDKYFRNLGKYDRMSNNHNMFKKKVVCGDCGTKLTRYKNVKPNEKKIYYTFICPHRARFLNQCSFLSIPEHTLKDIVMQSIRVQIAGLCDLSSAVDKASKSESVRQKRMELTMSMSDILANIAYIKSARIRLTKDFASRLLDDDEYKMAKAEFDSQLAEETNKLETVGKLRDKFDNIISAGKWIDEFKRYKGAKKLTQEMVDAFIKQIKVYPDKRIEIEWNYQEKQMEILSQIDGGVKIA